MSLPTWLLTGPLGSGKTTLLRHLLACKPDTVRWGVLINDLSAVDIDSTFIDPDQAVVRHLPGGCICCSVQGDFLSALDSLQAEPLDALWIEPTGMGDPQALVGLLRQRPEIDLRGVIAVLDAGVHTPAELQRWQSLTNMITIADGIVINKQDRAEPAALAELTDWLAGLYPPKQWVHVTERGRLPLSLAEQLQPYDGLRLLHPQQHENLADTPWPGLPSAPDGCVERQARLGEVLTLSWRWTADVHFDWPALWALFQQLGAAPFTPLMRAKGVFRVGDDSWMAFQWANGEADRDLSSWRRDSRLMLVLPRQHTAFDLSLFEQALRPASLSS